MPSYVNVVYKVSKIDFHNIDENAIQIGINNSGISEPISSVESTLINQEIDGVLNNLPENFTVYEGNPLFRDKVNYKKSVDYFKRDFEIYLEKTKNYSVELIKRKILEKVVCLSPILRRTSYGFDSILVTYLTYYEMIDGSCWISIAEQIPLEHDSYSDAELQSYLVSFFHEFETSVREGIIARKSVYAYLDGLEQVSYDMQPPSIIVNYVIKELLEKKLGVELLEENKLWISISNEGLLTKGNDSRNDLLELYYNNEDCTMIYNVSNDIFNLVKFELMVDAFLIVYSLNEIKRLIDLTEMTKSEQIDLKIIATYMKRLETKYNMSLSNKEKTIIDSEILFETSKNKKVIKNVISILGELSIYLEILKIVK